MRKKEALFYIFGAAGTLCRRVLIEVLRERTPNVKVPGGEYVKNTVGAETIELLLRDPVVGCEAPWLLEEAIPANQEARRIVASLLFDRLLPEFKEHRRGYGGGVFPTLDLIRKAIKNAE